MASAHAPHCSLLGLLLAALVGMSPNEATQIFSSAPSGQASSAFSLVGLRKNGLVEREQSGGELLGRSAAQEAAQKSGLEKTKRSLELSQSMVRVASEEEIMANMTVPKAYSIFMHMNHSHDASVVQVIESNFGQRKGVQNLRQVKKHEARKYDELSGLYTARDMLNEMMDETITNMEVENEKCENYELNQLRLIWESQQDIDFANAHAADSRAAALDASQMISTIQDPKIPSLDNQIQQNNQKCEAELGTLNGQLQLIGADMHVLKDVFGMIECDVVDMESLMPEPLGSEQMSLLDQRAGSNRTATAWKVTSVAGKAEDGSLVQCQACAKGEKPVVHMRHSRVQAELLKLKSAVAKELTREHLQEAFVETQRQHPSKIRPAVLIQGGKAAQTGKKLAGEELMDETCVEDMGKGVNGSAYRGCVSQTIGGIECQKWTSQSPHNHSGATNETELGNEHGLGDNNYCRNPTPSEKATIWCFTTDPLLKWGYCQPLDVVQAPEGITQHVCVNPGSCKIGPGNCERMRDRFLIILAGVVDKYNELSEQISQVDAECQRVHGDLTGAISTLNVQLGQEQTKLAEATKNLQEATNQENLASMAHTEYVKDYHEQMKECCDNKNGFLSELCSLRKLRSELFKMHNDTVTITDCEVADWTDSECTAACAGGEQQRTRSIIAHKLNGTACPPMTQERDCNKQACPIDCKVSPWSEWTECTAMCGGGVRTRMREKKVRPKYDGDQCPELQQTDQCNIESCNEDCVMGDWAEWTACSKACDTGHRERRMPVTVEERGTGTCPHPDSEQRVNFVPCNPEDCVTLLPDNQSTLECHSKLDVVILMDGSGSLEEYGFNQSKLMAERLLRAMVTGEDKVKVAFLMYGGPNTLEAFEKCTGNDVHAQVDAEHDCGMHWVAHFTADAAAVAGRVAQLPYPISTTMTSMALAEAGTEIMSGRQGAETVVLVITDAKPMSHLKTAKAASNMKNDARLMWVPIGPTMPEDLENMKTWASMPWQDNVVPIPDLDLLPTPKALNSIISSMCPDLGLTRQDFLVEMR